MVGNNLARDIRGANALGLASVWLSWNARYPLQPADSAETPRYQVGGAEELQALFALLEAGAAAPAFTYPRATAAPRAL